MLDLTLLLGLVEEPEQLGAVEAVVAAVEAEQPETSDKAGEASREMVGEDSAVANPARSLDRADTAAEAHWVLTCP